MTKRKTKKNRNTKKLSTKAIVQIFLVTLFIFLSFIGLQRFLSRQSLTFDEAITKYTVAPFRKNKAGFEYYSKVIEAIGVPKSMMINDVEPSSQKWNGFHMRKVYYGTGNSEAIFSEVLTKARSIGFEMHDLNKDSWFNPKYYPEKEHEKRWYGACNEATLSIYVNEKEFIRQSPGSKVMLDVYVYGNSGSKGEDCPDL